MKKDEREGWKQVWTSIGMMAASCLLGWFSASAEGLFGLRGAFYYIAIGILCAAYVVAIYFFVRRFFGKKK